MMRDIKFRAWDKEKKVMIDDQDQDADKHYPIKLGDWIHDTVWRIGKIRGTLMQYTGLKDRNGKEVYEGDVDSRGLVVEYVTGMSGYYLMKNGEGFHLSHEQSVLDNKIKTLEIIGNIYENPGLIEVKE